MSIFDQKVIKYEMKPLSSLEKVFPDETPVYRMECQMVKWSVGERRYHFRWHIPVIL